MELNVFFMKESVLLNQFPVGI